MIAVRTLIVFASSLLAVAALVPIARWAAVSMGIVARARSDRWHKRMVPLFGGVAIWIGTTVPALVLLPWTRASLAILIGGACMFLLGLVDDVVRLKPSSKLVGQLVVACLFVAAGARLHWVPSPAIDSLITLAWIVGITNAFNLLDNMDGLSAGIALIASVALAVVFQTDAAASSMAILLAGSCAAFLFYNFPPASIFMGDSGSLFLGFSLAALTLTDISGGGRGILSALAVPLLVMLIPIFDTALVTVSRWLSARRASVGGMDHSSHRLVALGFSEREAVLVLWAFAGISGATAVAFSSSSVYRSSLLIGFLLIALILLAIRLLRVRVYPEGDFSTLREGRYTPLIAEWTYRRRIFEIVLDIAIVSFAYYAAYIIRFDREAGIYYELFVQSLPLVIACSSGSLLAMGAYSGFWRYFSSADLVTYAKGIGLGTLTSIVALSYMSHFRGYSRGVFIVFTLLSSVLIIGSRLSFRLVGDLARGKGTDGPRLLIYGAGDGGALAIREVRQNHRLNYRIVGFIDDDVFKVGKRVMGIPVLGGGDALEALIPKHGVDVLLLATDSIEPERRAAAERTCFASGTSLLRMRFGFEPVVKDAYKS